MTADPLPVQDREPWEQQRAQDLRASVVNRARRLLALQDAGPEALAEDYARCKGTGPYDVDALIHWISWYGWVQDPQSTDLVLRDGTPFDLWPEQERVCGWLLERVRRRQIALCPKSRKIGITWLMLHIILWLWIFHHIGAIVGSRTQAAVDRLDDPDALFPKLEWMLDRQPAHIRPKRVERKFLILADLTTKATIRGQSTAANFARSSRELVTLLDEAGAVDARRMRSILSSTESAAGSLWLPYQPPEGPGHPLEDLFRELDPEMVCVLDWPVDPYRPPDFLESKIRPKGRLSRPQAMREYGAAHGTAPEGTVWIVPESAYYDETTPEWQQIGGRLRKAGLCVPGWDFGSGASQLACPFPLYEILPGGKLRVWIDDCRVWRSVSYRAAAADYHMTVRGVIRIPTDAEAAHHVLQYERTHGALRGRQPTNAPEPYREPYTGRVVAYGDPAGRARDSSAASWEINLRSEQVPLTCLEASYNDATAQRIVIQDIQDGLFDGSVRIHRRTEGTVGVSMRSWLWDTPAGQRPEEVNRAVLLPRKDWPSHVCNALMYSYMGARLELQRTSGKPSPQTRGPGSRQTVRDFLKRGAF